MSDEPVQVLCVRVDDEDYLVHDEDDLEDVRVLFILRGQRKLKAGDQFGADYYEFQAEQVGVMYDALRAGRLISQPRTTV